MEKFFLSVLNMSLTASFVIAAIMLARLPLKKAPKIISYCLWAVAGFRLVFPFTLESVFSLLPVNAAPIPQDIAMQAVPRIDSGITVIDNAVSAVLPAAAPYASINPLQILIPLVSYVWFIGVAFMLIYSFVSIALLKNRLNSATHIEGNLYEAENLKTPFVIGLFRPKIYIPAGLSNVERQYIVLHEQTHIRRGDHAVKMLAYFVLCLHWFNPLAWAAFILMGADMEMSCDERVMRELGADIKNAYSLSLVRVAAGRRILNGSPLAFGEGGMKERIKNILNFKKRSRLIITLAVALAAVLTVGFALNRTGGDFNYDIPEITAADSIDGATAKALTFGYSWYDGKNGVEADSIAPWQGEYGDENTLVLNGFAMNTITLSAQKVFAASYEIYLPDGTVFDAGTSEIIDSHGTRLFLAESGDKLGILAPIESGEYIYAVTIQWEKNDLEVTYGFKIVMTRERSAYDEAVSMINAHYSDALSIAFYGTNTLPDAEYAGVCYLFSIARPGELNEVAFSNAAVSKEQDVLFTYEDGTWRAFAEAAEFSGATG